KWIGLMRGRQPGDGHVELAFVQRQSALHNARGHRAGNAAPVFAALHHCGDDIFGMIEWSKTSEPGDRVLVAVIGRLGGAGLSGDLPSFQPRCATGDRKSTRLNSSHVAISYAVFCLKKK